MMRYVLPALLATASLSALMGGLVLLLKQGSTDGIEITLPTRPLTETAELKVYVTGEVRTPGVYEVTEGAILMDVVEAAGGVTGDADLAAVNLAIRVKDQDHWHIPATGEAPSALTRPAAAGSQFIDLNSATAAELMTLPGIGLVRAASILRYREANGPFVSVDEVLAVNGIGPAILEGFRDLVGVR